MAADGQPHSADLWEIARSQSNKCAYCKIRLTLSNRNLDHIIALATGGTNHRRNLQFLCSFCNRRKSDKDPIVFCREQGMLL